MYACPRRPTFRCRMGRGGRLYLDRRSMPRAPNVAQLGAQYRQQYGYDYDPFRYDDDGAADYDAVVLRESTRRSLVRHRAAMLSDIDQRCLLTQPAFIPFSPATAAAAQSTPMTPTTSSQASTKAATAAGPVTNGPSAATTDTAQPSADANHPITTTTATLMSQANGIGTPKSLTTTANPTVNGHAASERPAIATTNSPGAKSAKTLRGTDAFRAMFGSPGAVTSPVASFMTSPATLALNGTHSPFASPLVKPAQTQDLR
ncbi:hypothetical protein H4R35_003151 [Dimargaris xerosporica]|nr:hypothetical protein H4R35_003151 [Dimargaris xerosporica]